MTTFGINVKQGKNPIGHFGTGLKYAIAILLRSGCSITLVRGSRKHTFGLKKKKIRGKAFNFITMDGRELNFTSEVGKNWELWQAYRELHSNCVDEDGTIYLADEKSKCEANTTKICVEGLELIHRQNHDIILSSEPLGENHYLAVHPGNSQYIFYKGIRIHTLTKPTRFTYNIKRNIRLTEDRTASYFWEVESILRRGVAGLMDRTLIDEIITCPDSYFEKTIDFGDYISEMSDPFTEQAAKYVHDYSGKVNTTAVKACISKAPDKFVDQMVKTLTTMENELLTQALAFTHALGFDAAKFKIVVLNDMGQNVAGLAKKGVIYLAHSLFVQGPTMIATVLIEEFIHNEYGFSDETREMQNYLLHKLVEFGDKFLFENKLSNSLLSTGVTVQ